MPNDFPMVEVASVKPLGGFRLRLRFSIGQEGVRDFTELVGRQGRMLEPLRDETYFQRVFIEAGVLTWPNGFDLDPINLYMQMRDEGLLAPALAAE